MKNLSKLARGPPVGMMLLRHWPWPQNTKLSFCLLYMWMKYDVSRLKVIVHIVLQLRGRPFDSEGGLARFWNKYSDFENAGNKLSVLFWKENK